MQGTLVTGEGVGAKFVGATTEILAEAAGFRPYPGTVNLKGDDGVESLPLKTLEEDFGDPRCEGVHLRPCTIWGIRASVIRPLVPDYPPDKIELLAPIRIRQLFGLEDGATITLTPPDDPWAPDGPAASPDAIDEFEAIMFDLDGTLVDLAVDWQVVHDEIENRFGSSLEKSVTDHGQNELFVVAMERDFYEDLAGLIESYERDGAAAAIARAGVHELTQLDAPVGICTANAASAAERALERFDARAAVDAIVARGTTRAGKPDPEPLLACLDQLDAPPGNALFVGDQPSDAEAAAAAGTSFLHVNQLWPET